MKIFLSLKNMVHLWYWFYLDFSFILSYLNINQLPYIGRNKIIIESMLKDDSLL